MSAERFIKLVQENGGFEYYQAYGDDIDHILGGKGDTFWYTVLKKNKVVESYIGKQKGDTWEDSYVKGVKTKSMPAGSTIERIAEKAYLMQEESWVKGRNPKLIEDSHPHYHYVYGFGDKGLDVSAQYGVTIAFSDIKDPSAGFHLRYLYTGEEVELP
ncbi:MAG: hypothetical protein K6G22_03580 [Lachnospiraceae bacterium]|nr:hypothetical protein [Lachnospiraceae bacterium]